MKYDYLVIGSGMGGLTVASLLSKTGKKVCVLEAHEYPGGCCHSFPMGDYLFCAAVHYIFFCGKGEPVYNFLKKLDLHKEITFQRLDPEAYDTFSCPSKGLRFPIPNGLDKWRNRLIYRYPKERKKIQEFFRVITTLSHELGNIPSRHSLKSILFGLIKSRHLLRYRTWTLQNLFDALNIPLTIQAILATQLGDLGLEPNKVSLLVYTSLVQAYGNGAYYPKKHYHSFIRAIANVIQDAPGCDIFYETEVSKINYKEGKIVSVTSKEGREFSADTFISNIDPKKFIEMVGPQHFSHRFRKKVNYNYSVSALTLYLAVRGIDLRKYGFGKGNVWHYPDLDINKIYHTQHIKNNLTNPWMFMSTPSLYTDSKEARICPEDTQILEIVTTCDFNFFKNILDRNRGEYFRAKNKVRDTIFEIIEKNYIPNFRKHLVFKCVGTPTTNLRYLWTPQANIYGSELTPKNVDFGRLNYKTSIPNLYFTGASSGFPSIGATVLGGTKLYTHITGDIVNPR